MKRASYRDAIDWIAQNDSPGDVDNNIPSTVGQLVSSSIIADIFGVDHMKVGKDVCRRRLSLELIEEIFDEETICKG